MNFKKNQIVSLDNNEKYFVANTHDYNDKTYALLINVNKDDDYMIVERTSESLLKLINDEDQLTMMAFFLQNNIN